MAFFTRKQKQLAISCNRANLEKAYHVSEENLKTVSKSGNIKQLRIAMKQHGNYEYALLYKNTPEYKRKIKRRK